MTNLQTKVEAFAAELGEDAERVWNEFEVFVREKKAEIEANAKSDVSKESDQNAEKVDEEKSAA